MGAWNISLGLMYRCFPPSSKVVSSQARFQRGLFFAFQMISALGNMLEALAATVFSENDGLPLIVLARMMIIVSLGPLITVSSCLVETIWPSKRWRDLWILCVFFMLGSLAGFGVACLGAHGLIALACIMGFGLLYIASMWSVAAYSLQGDKSGVVGAILPMASYILLAVTDPSCGPPGHATCYDQCFVGAGMHYLIALPGMFGGTCALHWCRIRLLS